MFEYKDSLAENRLRTGINENKPISDVLKIVTPKYLTNLETNLIPTMLNEPIAYFSYLDDINKLIMNMSAAECKQFKITYIHGMGPFWSSLVLKKNSIWFEELNNIFTHRMTRTQGNKCNDFNLKVMGKVLQNNGYGCTGREYVFSRKFCSQSELGKIFTYKVCQNYLELTRVPLCVFLSFNKPSRMSL